MSSLALMVSIIIVILWWYHNGRVYKLTAYFWKLFFLSILNLMIVSLVKYPVAVCYEKYLVEFFDFSSSLY